MTIRLLATADMLAALEVGTALVTDSCRIIAGLDAQAGFELGAANRDGWHRISYTMARRLRKQVRDALETGFADEDTGQFCDLRWAAASLIAASIPPDEAARIEACAIERIPLPATAASRTAANSGRPGLGAGNGGGTAGGALFDSDGRLLRSSDPDALSDRRSAAARPGGQPAGHDAVIAIAVARHHRHGDANHPGPGRDECPPFALGVAVQPAGQPPGPAAFDLVRRAMAASPQIAEVAYDRGFASPPGGLAQPLHTLGINLAAHLPRHAAGHNAAAPTAARSLPAACCRRAPTGPPAETPPA